MILDEEDGKSLKKKSAKKSAGILADEYASSICLKEGGNASNNSHTKLSNKGNGGLHEVRNDLLRDAQKAKAELDQQLKSTTAEAGPSHNQVDTDNQFNVGKKKKKGEIVAPSPADNKKRKMTHNASQSKDKVQSSNGGGIDKNLPQFTKP